MSYESILAILWICKYPNDCVCATSYPCSLLAICRCPLRAPFASAVGFTGSQGEPWHWTARSRRRPSSGLKRPARFRCASSFSSGNASIVSIGSRCCAVRPKPCRRASTTSWRMIGRPRDGVRACSTTRGASRVRHGRAPTGRRTGAEPTGCVLPVRPGLPRDRPRACRRSRSPSTSPCNRPRTTHTTVVHGVFADSLPDGWGRLVMDRVYRRQGVLPSELTAMDRLSYIGDRGLGALQFSPPSPIGPETQTEVDLAELGERARALFEDRDADVSPSLAATGSSGGARPKALVYLPTTGSSGASAQPGENLEPWLVKFTSASLPLGHEESLCEAAYLTLANEAGIDTPEWRLIPVPSGARSSAIASLAVKALRLHARRRPSAHAQPVRLARCGLPRAVHGLRGSHQGEPGALRESGGGAKPVRARRVQPVHGQPGRPHPKLGLPAGRRRTLATVAVLRRHIQPRVHAANTAPPSSATATRHR